MEVGLQSSGGYISDSGCWVLAGGLSPPWHRGLWARLLGCPQATVAGVPRGPPERAGSVSSGPVSAVKLLLCLLALFIVQGDSTRL